MVKVENLEMAETKATLVGSDFVQNQFFNIIV